MEQVGDEDVVVDVNWVEQGFLARLAKFFGGSAAGVQRGQLVARRNGLAAHAERVRGAVLRWPWEEIIDLRIESGVASYLIVDVRTRPKRRQFALLRGGRAMSERDAVTLLERIRRVATANGWSPSTVEAADDEGDRAQRLAANTDAFVNRFPDAFVVRMAAAPDSVSRVTMVAGLAFASVTRFGHLVADAAGLRMYQGANDIEWEKPWREVMTLAMSDDGRALKLEALGWDGTKLYAPCEPNGDVLLPFAVKDVLAQVRSRRPAAGVR